MSALTSSPRLVRAVAVQPKWHARDFLSQVAFERWTRDQLEAARPHFSPTRPNLVVLTELNGLPLVLRGCALAAATERFRWALGLLLLRHLPAALPIMRRERVSAVRALQLARAHQNTALYLSTFSRLARQYGVYLASGSAPTPHYHREGHTLRRSSELYNQAHLFDPQGRLIGCADKVYLTPDEEAGGLDLSPGDLNALRVFPTPVGDLGVAISLDAFRSDVIAQLRRGGCTVMLQPDANGSPWTAKEGLPPDPAQLRDQPEAWLESSWQVTARGEVLYAVNPMVVGNLLDLSFDGQSAITGPADESLSPRSYVMTKPRSGFLALLPWVSEGPLSELRRRGAALAAHSGEPRENQYLTGVLSADLTLPPQTRPALPLRPHEQALQDLLDAKAQPAASPPTPGWVLAAAGACALLAAAHWRRRTRS